MDKMTTDKIREMLCAEADEIVEKGVLSAGDLETLHKITDTIKNVNKIEMLEEGEYSQLYPMDDGYDRDGGWEARGTYGRTGGRYSRTAYDRGNSYANRGMRYVRGHYSRAEAEDELMQKLREMSADMKLPEKYRKTAKDALAEMK